MFSPLFYSPNARESSAGPKLGGWKSVWVSLVSGGPENLSLLPALRDGAESRTQGPLQETRAPSGIQLLSPTSTRCRHLEMRLPAHSGVVRSGVLAATAIAKAMDSSFPRGENTCLIGPPGEGPGSSRRQSKESVRQESHVGACPGQWWGKRSVNWSA